MDTTFDESLIAEENTDTQEEVGEDKEKRHRIKIWMAVCLLGVSVIIDLIQFLLTGAFIGLILAPIISVGATFGFWTWFKLLGVSYVASPKKLATMVAQSFAEVIPGLDALPILTFGIFLIIVLTRMEDKGGALGKWQA